MMIIEINKYMSAKRKKKLTEKNVPKISNFKTRSHFVINYSLPEKKMAFIIEVASSVADNLITSSCVYFLG